MQNTALLMHLRRLNLKDFKELRKFVASPYFNQRKDVIKLFGYFDKVLNNPEGGSVKKEEVWKAVFPHEKFDDKKLHYASSFLLKTIKGYLIHAEAKEDKLQQKLYLCKALQKRGLGKSFQKEMKNAGLVELNLKFRNTLFHYNRYLFEREMAAHTMQNRRSGEMNLQTIHDELTTFFIGETLRQGCTILAHQTMFQQVYDLKLLEEVLDLVRQGGYETIPAVAIYYHAFCALSSKEGSDSEAHFYRLKKQIQQLDGEFPGHELRDIYLLAINFCIKKLNTGERQFIREAFELYKLGLANKALVENYVLSAYTYKNITRLGMNLGEIAWVGSFLHDFKKYLPSNERENSWRYNLAFYHFQQADYDSAMRLLRLVEFNDVLNNLDARRMLLRSYYELGEFTVLDSLLDSFKAYIHRQKDAGYHRDNYLNLIRFVRKMINWNRNDKLSFQLLKQEIENTERVAEKEWLLGKLQS